MPPEALAEEFRRTRERSVNDCAPLQREDYMLQAAVFASPPKWHLAHTSWFYETFILKELLGEYRSPDARYEMLFNSYYNGIGEQHPRDRRGLLSRPDLDEVLAYRQHVDAAMQELMRRTEGRDSAFVEARCRLGIEHERQHQELMFTDIKYSLATNPMFPAFAARDAGQSAAGRACGWDAFDGGLQEIGSTVDAFCFDNELPRHRVYLEPFELADRLVTNAEFQAFIDDDAYARPELWLADGWSTVQENGWTGPHHWVDRDGERLEFTLWGLRERDSAAPVCHVSGYEADAFARWAGARLPTEAEWESAALAIGEPPAGRDTQEDLHPRAATADSRQYFGACWQWTQSAYAAYPGFRASAGAIGEYNGKFMSNQWVLRGGSCVTWSSQARPCYRNFFYPQDRWQFSGIRLAR